MEPQEAHEDTLFHLVPLTLDARACERLPPMSIAANAMLGWEARVRAPDDPDNYDVPVLMPVVSCVQRATLVLEPSGEVAFWLDNVKRSVGALPLPGQPAVSAQSAPGYVSHDQDKDIWIDPFQYRVVWRVFRSQQELWHFATRQWSMIGLQGRLNILRLVPISVPFLAQGQSFEPERAPRGIYDEIKGNHLLGPFGTVEKRELRGSGKAYALKSIILKGGSRSLRQVHQGLGTWQQLSRDHSNLAYAFLYDAHCRPNLVQILLPLFTGSLATMILAAKGAEARRALTGTLDTALHHMLKALDFLASRRVSHLNVIPENILYEQLEDGSLLFQLSDACMVYHGGNRSLPDNGRVERWRCMAPELDFLTRFRQPCSDPRDGPKADVWSLAAVMVQAQRGGLTEQLQIRQCALDSSIHGHKYLAYMVEIDPRVRASAAQILMLEFDGDGLTTARDAVPPLPPLTPLRNLDIVLQG